MDGRRDLTIGARIGMGLVTYLGAMSVYFAAGLVARPPYAVLETGLDRAIPFAPWAMAGYALAYVVPASLLFVERTEAGMRRMMRAVILAYLVAAPFFVAMPVQDADPPLEGTDVMSSALELNRWVDQSRNAFPSMHVGLVVLLALIGRRRSRAWGWGLGIAAGIICVSTLLVKQHFLVDLPAGALVAWLAYRLVYGKESSP